MNNYHSQSTIRFEDLDVFGTPISLTYLNNPVYQTKCGSVLTLIFVVLSILSALLFGQEVFNRNNPTIIQDEFLMTKQQLIKLHGTFYFFFNFVDSNFKPLKDKNATLFNFSLNYIDSQTQSVIALDIDYCSNSDTFKDLEISKLFSEVELDDFFCLKNYNDLQHLDFKGQFGSNNYKYLQITVRTCTTLQCGSSQVIDYLNNSFFIFYFTEVVFNPKEFNNPLILNSNSVYTRVSLYNKKDLLFKMKHTQYITDAGYFYEDMKYNGYTTYDTFLESIKLNSNNQSDIITFQTQISDKSNRMQRKYLKITDLIAYLGGFLKIVFIIFQFIALPLNRISLETEFINQIFNLEKPQKITKSSDINEAIADQEDQCKQLYRNQMESNKLHALQSNSYLANPIDSNNILTPVQLTPTTKQRDIRTDQQKYNNNTFIHSTNYKKCIKKAKNKTLQIRRSSYEDQLPQLDNICEIKETTSKFHEQQNLQFNRKQIQERQTCLIKSGQKIKKKFKKIEIMQQIMLKFDKQQSQSLSTTEYEYSILKIGKKINNDANLIFSELFSILHQNVKMKIADYFNYIWLSTKRIICRVKMTQQKTEQIKFAINLINERMDIVFILKKLMEIEKIKMLVMDKDQREIFQYLPKPLVKYNTTAFDRHASNLAVNYQDQLFCDFKENSYQKCLKAAKAFQRIKNKQKLTKMDQNVIEIIGDKSQRLLDFLDNIQKPSLQNKDIIKGTRKHNNLLNEKNQSMLNQSYQTENHLGSNRSKHNTDNINQNFCYSKQSSNNISRRNIDVLIPGIIQKKQTFLQQQEEQILDFNNRSATPRQIVSKHEFVQIPKKNLTEDQQSLEIDSKDMNNYDYIDSK